MASSGSSQARGGPQGLTLHDKGVDLFLHQQGLDTSTTAGRAMFQMLGVFAEFERGIIRDAGITRAREKGTVLGRPRAAPAIEKRIRGLRAKANEQTEYGYS
jgi:DNA invertase Pin-like site-specific DNA recombinase